MTTTTLKTRIKLKNGTPEEWSQATNFSPLKGELVIYNDADNPRMKVGDGETNINDLPFVNNSVVAADLSDVEEGTEFDPGMINAESLGGIVAADYATKVYVDDAVSNLDTLGGKHVNEFVLSSDLTNATTSADGLMSSADKAKLEVTNIAYGTCDTDGVTAEKIVTIGRNSNWTLTTGSMIAIKFTNTNTAQNPTLNVNGTGAKNIWSNSDLITTSRLNNAGYANRIINYIYDGTQYVFIGWSTDSNTTYTNLSLGQGYGTCSTAAATAAKVVTMSSYSLTTGGIVVVKFTNAVPASATMNINSKGAKNIYYKGAAITANIIKAGDTATFIYDGTQYHLLTVDRSAFNTVYSGTFTTAGWSSSAPYTQTLTINGILASDYPDAYVNLSSATATTGPQLVQGWACIDRIATAANKVTAYCYSEKPTIALPAYFKVVR